MARCHTKLIKKIAEDLQGAGYTADTFPRGENTVAYVEKPGQKLFPSDIEPVLLKLGYDESQVYVWIDTKLEVTIIEPNLNWEGPMWTDDEILANHTPGAASLRGKIEVTLVRALIERLKVAGYHVGYEDPDDGTRKFPADLTAEVFNYDEVYLLALPKGEVQSYWVKLVFGNNGWDMISDYSIALENEMKPIDQLAERLEKGQFNISF